MADETPKPDAPGGEPGPNAPSDAAVQTDPAAEALRLATEVDVLQGQIADLTDRLLRAHAEMENIRKRAEREREETAKYAISKFARDLVHVADNFERAVQVVPKESMEQDAVLKGLVEGVSMTEREMLNVLERHGIRRICPKGEVFNPHFHQAMMEMENTQVVPGTVLEVYQCGYVIEDRVLRPAMVVVAKGGPKAPPRESGETAPEDQRRDVPPGGPSGAA